MDMRLAMQKRAHAALVKQIEADAALLAHMGVMDYSLLLGVHYPKWGETSWYPPGGNHTVDIQTPRHATWPSHMHLSGRPPSHHGGMCLMIMALTESEAHNYHWRHEFQPGLRVL